MNAKYYKISQIFVANLISGEKKKIFDMELYMEGQPYNQIFQIKQEHKQIMMIDIFSEELSGVKEKCYSNIENVKILSFTNISFFLTEPERKQNIISHKRLKQLYFELNNIKEKKKKVKQKIVDFKK